VSESVSFLKNLSSEELLACYAACDVFALPSSGEGFGLVFLEAMAFGKPVIGGAHGGTPDVIEDGVSGFLIPHGDVDRLTAVLRALLLDPALAAKMGAQAKTRVRDQFSASQFQQRLRHLLQDVHDRQ